MLKVIVNDDLKALIDFSWEASKQRANVSYPLRASRDEVERSLDKTMHREDDRLLAYYKEDRLIAVVECCIEVKEFYIQVKNYVIEDFEEVMDEIISYLGEHYAGHKIHFGFPKEHSRAISYFEKNLYECIEASSDLRLAVDDFTYEQSNSTRIKRIEQAEFDKYGLFHDTNGGEGMYWNSKRLYEQFDAWHIYIYEDGAEILGSILISKAFNHCIEIFALFAKKVANEGEIITRLLMDGIKHTLKREEGVEQVIFFTAEGEDFCYQVAMQIGFKNMGSYCCYLVNL